MKYFNNLLIILLSILIIFSFGCKSTAICGLPFPRHEIFLINDSSFTYAKWYVDSITNSIGLYSEGNFVRIDRNTYILNSYQFNPDSFKTNYKLYHDSLSGFRLGIFTDLFNDDFTFLKGKLLAIIDDKEFEFNKPYVDTTFYDKKIKNIQLQFIVPAGSYFPSCNYCLIKSLPINNISDTINRVEISFPLSSKYLSWYKLNNAVLYRKRNGKYRNYFLYGDNWPVNLNIK